jgi:hypothetical protein
MQDALSEIISGATASVIKNQIARRKTLFSDLNDDHRYDGYHDDFHYGDDHVHYGF